MTVSTKPVALSKVLTPGVLKEVHEFWFQGSDRDSLYVLPTPGDLEVWFKKSVEFDNACTKHFDQVLTTIRSTGATVADILATAAPSSGLDWLGLILLLDQIPRNCYRDSQAAIAFTVFDPLVQDIAQRAIEAGIPRRDPQLRYRLARRFWFYMPLMHSEDPAVHVKAVSEFKQIASDLEVLTPEQAGADEEEEKVIALLTQKKEEGEKFCTELLRYEIGHQELITKFGRYPYRNEPLGRKSTPEEQAFLDKGPPYF